jgi:hypothetical protein
MQLLVTGADPGATSAVSLDDGHLATWFADC